MTARLNVWATAGPEERQRSETIFAENAYIQRRCLVLCRKGKEEYFSNADLYRSEDERVACSLKFRTIQPAIESEPSIYHEEMEQVLNRPLAGTGAAQLEAGVFCCASGSQTQNGNTTARIDNFDRRRIQNGICASVMPGGFL